MERCHSGFRHGSVFFQHCSDAIRFIMADTFGYSNLYNYTDDLVYTGLPGEIEQSYHTLSSIIAGFSLNISTSKFIEPTNAAVCLAIEINSVNRTLQIPMDKLSQIQQICQEYVPKRKSLRTNSNHHWVPSSILRSVLNQLGFS